MPVQSITSQIQLLFLSPSLSRASVQMCVYTHMHARAHTHPHTKDASGQGRQINITFEPALSLENLNLRLATT